MNPVAMMTLLAATHASTPAKVLNLAGPEILATREVCQKMAQLLGVKPIFEGSEHDDALLNNGQLAHQLLGGPAVLAEQMIPWTARWIAQGGATLNKPTHFQTRSGKF